MKFDLKAAIDAVETLGERAIALAEDGDKPAVQQLVADARSALPPAEALLEESVEVAATRILTPAVGADAAKVLAADFCRAGEAAVMRRLNLTAQPGGDESAGEGS